MMTTRASVLILGGGDSSEREVSLRSAANVARALRASGTDVTEADPGESGFDLTAAVRNVDAVMPILHGRGGEDGVLQAQLEDLNIPFLGAGSAACRLTFDKVAYREFMIAHGVLVAAGELVDRQGFDRSAFRRQPYVLKPFDGGSSVDTYLVHRPADEPAAATLNEVYTRNGGRMLIEELISGTEITVGVLGDAALPVIEIVPPAGEVFDYDNKYNGRTQEIVNPPDLPQALQRRAQELALDINRLCGCRHLSRTDMIVTKTGTMYVLETNTIPGLTDQSLLPKAAAAAGLTFSDLCLTLVRLAGRHKV